MNEQLLKRAETIKKLIRQEPGEAVDLLLDFARLYAVDDEVETEILMLQYELASMTDRDDVELLRIKTELINITDSIVEAYNPEVVALRLETEKKLAEIIRERKLLHQVVLRAKNITKSYPSSRFKLEAQHLELRTGEITGLVGENATGKTTLLQILTGELAQQSGDLRYPLFDPENKKHWPDLKLKIAYVPQELPAWQGRLLENLTFEAALHGLKGAQARQAVEYIVQRLGLSLHIDKSWKALSGGYKLRFALAKALVWQPQLLILDEPLAFLDIKTQVKVLSDLRDLAKSLKNPIAILLSSQHLHETESVADQMWFMQEGLLENLGPTKKFNDQRDYNLFELSCDVSFNKFKKALIGFPMNKIWSNDTIFCISTPPEVNGIQLIQYLSDRGLTLTHFRDISQSVKTRFYAGDL